ncbi:MAG: TldD/PmbA family protein [Treponema sp.]|nr:TldD/PmbA family protein [Treponema sp.]
MIQDLLSAQKGAFKDYTELRAQVNSTQQVVLLAGNMVANAQSETGGVSARVYRGGTYGFASNAEYSQNSVQGVLKAATENAATMDKNVKKGLPPFPAATPGRIELGSGAKGQKPKGAVAQNILIDYVKALDALIVGKYKDLTSRTVIANCLSMEKMLTVSDGADGHHFSPRSLVMVMMTALTPEGTPVELFKPFGGFGRFDEIPALKDPALLAADLDTLHEQLMALREGVHAQAGTRKCVLHPDLGGMLVHEAVGHTVEADLVRSGSVAAHNMNKRVGSDLVNMVDFAHTALGQPVPMPVYLDDEGVIAEDVNLIENGILKSYMHSRESAQHFGVEPQGNARAFAFSDEPLIRMRNTAILPGKDKLEDMIASVDDGYYLVKTGNGQADATGEFMFSVTLGYEIKGGKIGKAIRETTMSGVAFEMLKTIDMVSDDMNWTCAGMCGKKQPMPVGMGGPAVRCDMNIGGR